MMADMFDVERELLKLDIPIHARLMEPALAEGGDLLWLRPDTLAAGLGFRTNREGIDQLARALDPLGVTVVPVPLSTRSRI